MMPAFAPGSAVKLLCRRRYLTSASAVAILLAITPASVEAAPHQWHDARFSFDISEQDLASSLLVFAQQAKIQLVMNAAVVRGYRVPAVHGSHSPERVLQTLLGSAPFSAEWSGPNTLAIRPASAARKIAMHMQPVQQAPAGVDFAQAPAPVGTGGIQEIVVTARKREESLRDVPASVTAITEEVIQRYDLSSLERVAAATPSLVITRADNGSGATLSLRGIGSSFTSIGIEQSVATVVDGVYYGQGRIINEGLFDLARIEILKGPQSLFFGKNSTAGVVSITTADPGNKPEFIGRLGYEFRAKQVIGEAIGSGPLSDTLGIRVAVRASKMAGGYLKDTGLEAPYPSTDVATGVTRVLTAPASADGPREKLLLGRVTLKWVPTEELTATLKMSANVNRVGNPSWNHILYDCATESLPAGTPCGRTLENQMTGLPSEIAAVLPFAKKSGKLFNDYESYSASATINYATDTLFLTSVTNFNRNKNVFLIDGDYTSATTNWVTERDKFRAFSSEVRALTTFDGPINLLAGGYYQRTKLNSRFNIVFSNVEDSAASPDQRFIGFSKRSHTTDETIAAFGQAIWKVVPDVELTGGVRYTHETKDSDFVQPRVNPALAGVFVENVPFTANQTFNNWAPEITASWKASPDVTVYGAYKAGFKSGGFSNTGIQSAFGSTSDFVFDPEKAMGFEAGVRSLLFDRQLRFNVGVYSYKFTNLQVDFFNSTSISFVTTNAGAATTRGVEVDFEYAPRAIQGFALRGSVNYNKAQYKDYLAPCYAGQTIAEGCNLVVSNAPFQDLSGAPTANAPRWTGSLGANFDTPITAGWILGLSVDSRYSDRYLATAFNNPRSRQPSYINLDASVRVRTEDDRWELALIGRNLTNRVIVNGGHDHSGGGSGTGTALGIPAAQVGLVGLPRTVQAQISFRY